MKPADARTQCWLYLLDKSLTKPAVPLGTKCSEGPAVSRKRMHIAWTHVSAQYPDKLPMGSSQMHEADIVYERGVPKLANQRLILDSRDLPFRCTLETQNFVAPGEGKLTFSAYGYQGTDVCVVDVETKKVTNLTNSPDEYDEPEGIFPDGQHTLVECDRQNKKGSNHVDLWKLRMDGGGYAERLTNFSDYPGYKASNPAVSDDGRYIAFQMAMSKDAAGLVTASSFSIWRLGARGKARVREAREEPFTWQVAGRVCGKPSIPRGLFSISGLSSAQPAGDWWRDPAVPLRFSAEVFRGLHGQTGIE